MQHGAFHIVRISLHPGGLGLSFGPHCSDPRLGLCGLGGILDGLARLLEAQLLLLRVVLAIPPLEL